MCVVGFLGILLGFRVLAEEAGMSLYEFFCGTLTVTCEGFEEAVILHTWQVPGGPPWGQEALSSFSHLLGSSLTSEGDHTLSPS